MATDGERIATLEQLGRDIRDDIGAWTHEQERTRHRLHELEATVRGLVLASDIAVKNTDKRQWRMELRVQVLTLVVGIGAVASPLIVYLSGH